MYIIIKKECLMYIVLLISFILFFSIGYGSVSSSLIQLLFSRFKIINKYYYPF